MMIIVWIMLLSCSMSYGNVDKIDSLINSLLNCTRMTGVSLAVAHNGQIYHTKGYGVKHLDTKEPVTEETMFVIASITKHMVGTTMARVIEEHSNDGLSWSSKVHDELPHFHFSDPIRTKEVHITDLFTHRTGQGLHNVMRIAGFTIEELMERIRHLGFVSDFRDGYNYNNLMYGLASYIIQAREGKGWEEVAKEQLFAPLGMDKATFVNLASDRWDEFARPFVQDDHLKEVPMEFFEFYYGTISAPGGVCSNAVDMAKWMNFQLSHGQSSTGEQVVPASLMRDLHTASNVINVPPSIRRPNHPYTRSSQRVGKGWNQGFYKGLEQHNHGGSIGGYTSHMSLLPDKKIGVYTAASGPVPLNGWAMIHTYIMDVMMGEEPWVTLDNICPPGPDLYEPHVEDGEQDFMTEEETIKKLINGKQRNRREAEEVEMVGTYGNFAYGNITIFVNEDTGRYNMLYGEKAYFDLEPIVGMYRARGMGALWQNQFLVMFDGDEVTVTFDLMQPPMFERGLKQSDAPPPPELCPQNDQPDPVSGKANTYLISMIPVLYVSILILLISH